MRWCRSRELEPRCCYREVGSLKQVKSLPFLQVGD
jgi:hypothetical protein